MFLTSISADSDRSPWGDFWFAPVGNRSGSGMRVTAEQAMRLTAVYACVRNLSEDFAKLPFRMFRQAGELAPRTPVTEHWLLRLMCKRPNRWQTPFNWREMMQGHLTLRGNAFNELVVDGQGEITDLLPIHPDRVKIELLDNGSFRYRVKQADGPDVVYRRDELWHIKGLSPDGYVGYNPIELQADMLGAGMSAQDYAARFFANDARPSGGWIEIPGKFADRAARQVFQESWQQGQGGKNRGKTAVLEGGMKFHDPVPVSNRDSQFIEARQMTIADIARMFRQPPHKIGDLSKATFSNIEQQSIEYGTDTMSPWCERWESSIECDLLGEDSGLEVEFDLRQLMRGDSAARVTYYTGGINGGWLTRNEARAEEGLDPIDGLDEPLQPLNMVEAGAEPVQTPAAPAAPGNDDAAAARLGALLQGNAQRMARRMVAAAGKPPSPAVLAESMAVGVGAASAWIDAYAVGDTLTDTELTNSLVALGAEGRWVEPSAGTLAARATRAGFEAVAGAIRATPAPVINVATPQNHVAIHMPVTLEAKVDATRAVTKTVVSERLADGTIISKVTEK